MLGALLLVLLLARLPGLLAATQPRTLVRAGLLVPVEERHQEQLLTAAVEIFNADSEWLQVELGRQVVLAGLVVQGRFAQGLGQTQAHLWFW